MSLASCDSMTSRTHEGCQYDYVFDWSVWRGSQDEVAGASPKAAGDRRKVIQEDEGKHSVPPLLAVGNEGLFGTLSILILLPLLPLVRPSQSSPTAPRFDLVRGWHQLIDTPSVLFSGIVIACSIALFNAFVTKCVSATARSLTDTCRTLAIWTVSLLLGWEMLMWHLALTSGRVRPVGLWHRAWFTVYQLVSFLNLDSS
jgi:hypothetical protein